MTDSSSLTLIFLIFFICGGLLLTGLSIPMALGRIKPNGLYGFRTAKTLSDERIWYAVNAYAGRRMLVVGMLFIQAVFALYLIPALQADLALYNILCTLALSAGMAWVIVSSVRYMNSL